MGNAHDYTQGGNNTLTGGNSSSGGTVYNFFFGTAQEMSDNTHAGNNILIAGTADASSTVINDMWGNAQTVGSNVTLGQDTFIFKDNVAAGQTVGTQNFIHDFSQSQHDLIMFVHVAGVTSFNDLLPFFDTASDFGSTIIHAGNDVVTLVGFTGTLTAGDFLFA